jgi:hypothetical protein
MAFDLNSQRDMDMKRVATHVEELGRLFDTVQVFVSRHDPTANHTVTVQLGEGNWCARRGQVREWMLEQDEISRAEVSKEDEE